MTRPKMAKLKQVILIRKDLKMRKGKEIAQGAHASMAVLLNYMRYGVVNGNKGEILLANMPKEVFLWATKGFRKIVVGVNSVKELRHYYHLAKRAGLPCSYIVDNGETEFHGKDTATAVAIGPAAEKKIDVITGKLQLL